MGGQKEGTLSVSKLGILAYGSLIDDPGAELQEIIIDQIPA